MFAAALAKPYKGIRSAESGAKNAGEPAQQKIRILLAGLEGIERHGTAVREQSPFRAARDRNPLARSFIPSVAGHIENERVRRVARLRRREPQRKQNQNRR